MKMVSLERRGPKGREGLSLKQKRSLALGNSTERNWDQWLEVTGKQRVHNIEALFNTWSPPRMQKCLTKLSSLPPEVFKKLNQCLLLMIEWISSPDSCLKLMISTVSFNSDVLRF